MNISHFRITLFTLKFTGEIVTPSLQFELFCSGFSIDHSFDELNWTLISYLLQINAQSNAKQKYIKAHSA